MNSLKKNQINSDYFNSIGNNQTIDLEVSSNNSFPNKGIYIGELENIATEKFPALIYLEQMAGLCFLTTPENRDKVHRAIQNIALRILLEIPKGLLKYHLYDPTGLGNNLIYLSQLSPKIKGENILVNSKELKRMLVNSITDIPNVIQKVLGHKYKDLTLEEYNRNAGALKKNYHILFLVDYPHSFNVETNDLLLQMLQSGKRAGYFNFISIDTTFEPKNNYGIDPSNIINKLPCIYEADGSWYIQGIPNHEYFNQRFKLQLNSQIPDNLDDIIDYANDSIRKIKQIKVSLLDKLTEKNFSSYDASEGIDIPIGKTNFTDLQKFTLSIEDGESDNPHHCLIGGSTGAGKTVLLHTIICHTAWFYSPEDVNLILLDYKEGTEFKVYENLPHVKILTINSELEYGVSILEFIEKEFKRRGTLFKKENVSSISKYNQKSGQKLPRILVIIDEFQKLLDGENRKISSKVTNALNDIGRRGRSFGVNLILSTQSLKDINISNILSHLGLRIVLRLAKSDCDRMLGFDNHVPSTFTKTGEAIYNTRSGLTEGNVRFQVAYIDDENELNDLINDIKTRTLAIFKQQPHKQFIYDGSIKPSPETNSEYHNKKQNIRSCNIFIGEPVSLRERHVYYKIRKQNESNVLIIGQDIESAVSIFKHSYLQIQNQSNQKSKYYLFNKLNVDNSLFDVLNKLENVLSVSEDIKTKETIEIIHSELKDRINGKEVSSRIVVGFFDVNNIRSLRKEGPRLSSLGQMVTELLADGSNYNIHCIVYSYSFNRFTNVFDYIKSLSDFDTKIELNGGDGFKIFKIGYDQSNLRNGIGRILTPFDDEIKKFKPYSLD